MTMFKGRYRIESTRLLGWDYTAGWYFVTICTHQCRHFFGAVVDGAVRFSPIGAIVAEEWQRTAQVRSNVILDAWVVMPNHFHGIIAIRNTDGTTADDGDGGDNVETPRRGVSTTPPTPAPPASVLRGGSLGAIIGQWKSVSTKRIRAAGHDDFAWQSRFYDVIIRDDRALNTIRRYIADNSRRWSTDHDRHSGIWM